MNGNIEIIAPLVPKNDANFGVIDVNLLKGGYVQVQTTEEMNALLLYTDRLKEGMLCYVVLQKLFYQLLKGEWSLWSIGGKMELQSVVKAEDLVLFESKGLVVYVEEFGALRYYDGTWRSFAQIYVQDTPPDDLGGMWIDTHGRGITHVETTTASILKMINLLAKRIKVLEYREQQILSGEVSNNMYNEYDLIVGIDPGSLITGDLEEDEEGSTEEEDYNEELLLMNTLLADSEEPVYYKDSLPNVKHILIKWGTYANMMTYKDHFLPAELIFSHNTNELWIKHPKTQQLVRIGSTIGGSDDPIEDDIMEGIILNGDYIGSISFVDLTNPKNHYTFSVLNGELELEHDELKDAPLGSTQEAAYVYGGVQYYKTPYFPQYTITNGEKTAVQGYNAKVYNSMLHINMVYAAPYNQYNPCNFSFIEITNLTQYPINLNGFYLHYSEGYTASTRKWISLPLKGLIKGYSSYLIRCCRTSSDKFAQVKVGKPDVYFSKANTYNSTIFDNQTYSIWDDEDMLKLNTCCSLLLTGPVYVTPDSREYTDAQYTDIQLKSAPYAVNNPWLVNGGTVGLVYGFCDLVGFGSVNSVELPSINKAVGALSKDKIAMRYYALDNVSQAYKSQASTDSTADKFWKTINISTPNQALDITKYAPKNSKEGKNIFFNKHLIEDGKPTFVTCTFGYNPHTTRCFTWVSKGYRDEFIQYRIKGTSEWTLVESFKAGDGRAAKNNRNNAIYNRIRSYTTDGTSFTSHKCILDFSEPPRHSVVIYEYRVGYNNNWTDVRLFTLRNRLDVIEDGFLFVQVTDQQGFNLEEYEEWRLAAEYINKHYINAYTYERTNTYEGSLVNTLPDPNLPDSPNLVIVKLGIFLKKSVEVKTYKYEETEGPVEFTAFSNVVPDATATSPQYIAVGNLYQLIEGVYEDIDETAEGFLKPASPAVYEELPSVINPEEPFILIGKYYVNTLVSTEIRYSYEAAEADYTDDGIDPVIIDALPVATADSPVKILIGIPHKKQYNNIEFSINTGDATLNGNRINEWIDYFNAGDSLFSKIEQMYEVGNNDLCPVIPFELGLGTDATKQNPINVNYFFTFEHPFNLPLSSTGVYVPCVYSFIYGNTYFLGMNSELTDESDACSYLFGLQGQALYGTLKEWAEEDLTHAPAVEWKLAFCHESPFTLLIKDVLDTYGTKIKADPNYKAEDRGQVTSHFNNPGGWWFSKFLEDNGFNMAMCGHKHTYTNSRYLHDNEEDRMKPYVYDPAGSNATFINSNNKEFMIVTNDQTKHYVKYVMCQATGYKLTSNKELPGQNIGWLREYYPITDAAGVNTNQRYPHYIIWHIGKGNEVERPSGTTDERNRILGRAKKIYASRAGSLSAGNNKPYKYDSFEFDVNGIIECGGNGSTNPYDNIICDKLPYFNVDDTEVVKYELVDADEQSINAETVNV